MIYLLKRKVFRGWTIQSTIFIKLVNLLSFRAPYCRDSGICSGQEFHAGGEAMAVTVLQEEGSTRRRPTAAPRVQSRFPGRVLLVWRWGLLVTKPKA